MDKINCKKRKINIKKFDQFSINFNFFIIFITYCILKQRYFQKCYSNYQIITNLRRYSKLKEKFKSWHCLIFQRLNDIYIRIVFICCHKYLSKHYQATNDQRSFRTQWQHRKNHNLIKTTGGNIIVNGFRDKLCLFIGHKMMEKRKWICWQSKQSNQIHQQHCKTLWLYLFTTTDKVMKSFFIANNSSEGHNIAKKRAFIKIK